MEGQIRWGRIVMAAVLLEVAISLLVLPFALIFGNPLEPRPGEPLNATPYFVAAAFGCAVLGFLSGFWVASKAASRFALHGLLVGITATLLYFGLCSLAPGGIPGVVAAYSAGLYALFNTLRIVGCWSGGIYLGMRRQRS
jgi:hypothetical protein